MNVFLQVEATLTNDPDNEDLLKLKKDLQVCIMKALVTQESKCDAVCI